MQLKSLYKPALSALLVGFALGVSGCSEDGNTTNVTNSVTSSTNTANSSSFAVSQNGSTNSGTVAFKDFSGNVSKTLFTGGNEAISLDAMNNIVQNNDRSSAPANSIVLFSHPALRPNNATFSSSLDAEVIAAFGGRPKGGGVVPSRGIALVAAFNGRTIAGTIVGVSLGARGTAASPVDVLFTTAPFTIAASNLSSFSGLTSTSPWDLEYDEANDRLFVALTDGTVAVFDTFFASGPNNATASRFFQPGSNSFNAHGIDYDSSSDTLLISDVGSVTSGANSDGRVFLIPTASSASGALGLSSIAGALTNLGNPVDAQFGPSAEIIIAEKTNDRILDFRDVLNAVLGNNAAANSVNSTKPESIVNIDNIGRDFIDPNDTTSPSAVSAILVVQNPASNNVAGENIILSLNPTDLTGTTTFDLGAGLTLTPPSGTTARLESAENIATDNNGGFHFCFGNDSASPTEVGEGGVGFVSMGFRPNRFSSATAFSATLDNVGLRGSVSALVQPKGLEVTSGSRFGFFRIICDFGTDATNDSIKVFGGLASSNALAVANLTNLGDAGRRPWDCDYSALDDRLFVACTDGNVIVYDNFLSRVTSNNAPSTPDRVFNVTFNAGGNTSVNFHGVAYDRANDSVYLTDVNDPTTTTTDGAIVGVRNASSRSGTVASFFSITDATRLNNPVDIAFDGSSLFVAEKHNSTTGRVYRYANPNALTGDTSTAPVNTNTAVVNPESVTILTTNTTNSR
jgi:hypothetical protein